MVPRSANAAEAALLAKKKAAKNQPKPPFNPSDPSTWPQATPGRVAQMQADQGYKPLTGKATGQYVAPDTNMYNATPTDVARGTVGFLNTNLRDPLYRTFSTQNLQKALNPNTNETDRALAIAEDTLNIASVVPGVRAIGGYIDDAVRFADDGVNALARAWGRYKNRSQATDPILTLTGTKESSQRLNRLMDNERDLMGDLLDGLRNVERRVRPSTDPQVFTRPEWEEKLPEGIKRFWHTTPHGGKLQNPLLSMYEAARLPSRRGSGAAQLMSGGPYATDSGLVSSTYAQEMLGGGPNQAISKSFPYSVMPDRMVDDLMSTPAVWDKIRADTSFPNASPRVVEDIRKLQIQDYKNSMFDIDSVVTKDMFGKDSISAQRFDRFGFKNKTLRQILDESESPQRAMQIINDLRRPAYYKPKPKNKTGLDWAGKKASDIERISFKHPIIKNPDNTYGTSAVVAPDMGVYLYGKEAESLTPFSDDYYRKLDELRDVAYRQEIESVKATHPGFDEEWYDQVVRESQRTGTVPIYDYFRNNRDELFGQFRRTEIGFPGQNYWDLPVTRDDAGNIASIGGFKALDLANAPAKEFDELASHIKNFVRQRYPEFNNDQYVQGLIDRFRYIPQAQEKTRAFTELQNELVVALQESDTATRSGFAESLTPKEEMYEYLQQQGYGVIPHAGGQMTRNQSHLAVNFLKPDFLPPSKFIPGGTSDYKDIVGSLARQRAMQMREFMSQGTGRELTGYLTQERMNKRLTDATRAALLAPIAGTPRQATSSR